MIIVKEFPGKTFSTKAELFTELRLNATKIMECKKAEIHKSYHKDDEPMSAFLLKDYGDATKGIHMKEDYIYPVINTTNYMDSHKDVHFNGIWTKSAKEQDGKLFYAADHLISIGTIIAWPSDVKVMVKSVPWSFVGRDYPGNTEALIYEIAKNKIVHATAKQIIEEKRPVQNSVRMMYVKLSLGMNSDAKEDVKYKEYYDSRINEIANKEIVAEDGYFWGVEEAKIVKEGSMVIAGSNDSTPIRQKNTEAVDNDTSKTEPAEATQEVTKFINVNLY